MALDTTASPPPLTSLPPPPPVYFAVGPNSHEIICPYCKTSGKTRLVRSIFRCCSKRHYCSTCGEYLGTYRRPQL